MKPETLFMRNFGPFSGEARLDFRTLDGIFLITGKTGSGKTTIFDAICFALYGKVPGSRGDHLTRLKSDFSAINSGEDSGTECFVRLDFQAGSKRYRVERSPKQKIPKRRGGGDREIEEQAALFALEPAGPVALNTKKSEADEKIREITGLDAQEFFRIVLLPQGEFAEFLRQNTTDRQKTLGKLFPLESAGAVKNLALEKAREAVIEREQAERALEEISARVTFRNFAEQKTQAEIKLEAARKKASRLVADAEILRRTLVLRREEAEILSRLEDLERENARAEEGRGEIAGKEKSLRESREARPLAELLAREDERRREEVAAKENLEKTLRENRAAETTDGEARKSAESIPLLEEELAALRKRREKYGQIVLEEKEFHAAGREVERMEAESAQLGAEAGNLKKKLDQGSEEIARLEAACAGIAELEKRRQAADTIRQKLIILKRTAADGDSAAHEEKESRLRAEARERECAELGKIIPVLEAERDALKREKEKTEKSKNAALLASELKPGEPCPVCGAKDHPDPAAAHPGLFGAEERIAAQEKMIAQSRESLSAKEAERDAALADNRRARRKLEEICDEQREVKAGSPLPETGGEGVYQDMFSGGKNARESYTETEHQAALLAYFSETEKRAGLEETARLLERHVQVFNSLVSIHESLKRSQSRLADLRREESPLRANLSEKEKTLAALSEKLRGKKENLETLASRRKSLFDEDGTREFSPEKILGEIELAAARKEEALKEIRENRDRAARALAVALDAAAKAETRSVEAARNREAAEGELQKSLKGSPFENAAHLRAALLDPAAENALEEEIRAFRDGAARRDSLRAEITRSLEETGKKIAALVESASETERQAGDGLAERLEQVEAARKDAEREREAAAAALAALERDGAELALAHARLEKTAKKSRLLELLAMDMNGKNPKKKSFDAWLLGRYLEKVAKFATKRLQHLSEGRYSLLLDSEAGSGNAKTGLELAVFDAHTGKKRPCATLSGGESFMASISLALGLADTMQDRRGGVRLDAVFVDEGFGSLDEATLDLALGILDEIKEQRMVALISHVAELRNRIPSRVEVIKTSAGSRIEIP